MYRSEIIIDEKYSGLNPVQFGSEDCEPGHSFGPAVRTYWLIHYVNSGSGIFLINGEKYPVGKDELFVIPPYIQTYYEADKKTPWDYTWIGFTSGELFLKQLPHVLKLKDAKRIFSEMSECTSLVNGKSAFLAAKLWELFSEFLDGAGKKEPEYVELAIGRMQAEYMNGIKIDDIAHELHIDRSYLSALFREATGYSPKEYLTDIRMNKAVELMVKYGQSPSTAAISTGYPDVFSFSKMFKKKFGVSPRTYKNGQWGQVPVTTFGPQVSDPTDRKKDRGVRPH